MFRFIDEIRVCLKKEKKTVKKIVFYSTTPVRFPVKMTSPSTAILYITEDVEYITQLKETLHVKEIEIGREF